ncbi:T-lymphoma invasion and metastasis-inducing protein 2-like isoform X2 [Perca fluviatilis]|uniref:T-lymphoma invasion and metastasis-inducing protein 2-like isoform X2 n=1 Tax=Perca fluviatilis TaxID=8168 RepID=UPI0019645787|nr:T-lymphoma invasion and metastasis-inducing protein 2-like isoform X2 [Perca fluviatilis]
MGNSESQYSIQGPKGTSFVFPGKPKPYSLKLRAAKDDALSPHTWWKSAPVGSGYKARCVGRGCLSPPKSRPPYSPRHCDYVSKGTRGSPSEHRWHRSPGCGIRRRHMSDEYEDNPYGADLNRSTLNGNSDEHEALEEQSSPRVVIKKDGSLRVEFTNTSGNPLLLDEASGPVQLLKFSPNMESASTPSLPGSSGSRQDSQRSGPPPASTSSTARTSKGSSLSSDGSWYDSPWGPSTELCEQDQPCAASRTLVHSPSHQLDSFTEQSPPVSITDLYKDSTMAATFPTARDLSSHLQQPPPGQRAHRASFASVLDVPLEEESPEACQYSSYTLPCRRPKALTMSEDLDQYPNQEQAGPDFGFHKKDSIKNRIRRFSDWTGSLSRKKRKSQGSFRDLVNPETRYKDLSDAFDSGVDGLTADTSSPSQVSSVLWFPGASRAQSSGAIHQTTSDALRQNIYENFMRELETGTGQGGGGGGERRDPSTGTEEGESSSESAEGSLEQLDLLFEKEQGVVRRAGWLSFKPLITLHKDRKLELVTRRKWKQYWVTLKGCTLLFYETYGKGSPEQELSPRYALLAEDSIVQAVPEHPKKENVFCLSNSYGDVYLFQASNQTDLENWVTAIHSASASLLAKRQGKEDTVRLLRSQVRGLLQKIDMDGKMKKMAELQLTVVSDPKNRKAIENQIQQWEQNLERFNMDLFRMRCYLASLQGGELPNPKSLLAIASRPTKSTLGRLGIFSVSSFHSLICSRDEATLRRRSLSLNHRQRKRGLFSSLKGLDNLTKRGRDKRPSASQIFESDAGGQTYALPPRSTELEMLTSIYSMSPPEGGVWDSISGATDVLTCVHMPDGLTVQVPVRRDQTAADLLSAACKVKQLDPGLHCLRLHRRAPQGVEVQYVGPGELLCDVVNDQLEVVPVNVFTLHMSKPSGTGDFGFAVTGHIDSQKNSRIFVSEVLPDDLAFNEGLRPGDEVLGLNGRCVSGLDLALIQTLFAEQTLHLTLRRDGPLPLTSNHHHPLAHNQEVPSKHHRAKSSSDVFSAADGVGLENGHSHCAHRPVQHSKSVDTVCTLYQSFQEGMSSGPGGLMDNTKEPPVRQGGELRSGPTREAPLLRPCPKHMSATERLRKVIQELVDTEKSYVKDLACLFEIYLKPLQNETFLTLDEMDSLFGSLPEMLDFQRVFLQTLEERIASSPDFSTLETPSQFKKLLFSLGGSFLYYADHFKLYSGFCANHIKVQKVLERAKTDQAFKEFLDARNPTKQHSSTLESYLIKPVQRVLKYPLLLRELVSLTDADSEEHYHLTEALKAMEKVASHINEMQKIYEDYGSVFDQLVSEQSGHDKEVTEISMGEFLMHSSVVWLNPHTSLGRMRKDPEMTVFVFKKAVILVYRENNKLKKKMTNSRSALSHGDSDPFKFRWLIPLSALQVRLGNTAGTGTESSCIWELIHSRSEVEGRPETVFQLCSSVPENKVHIIKVIRSILRENVKRNMRSEGTLERSCKERLVPLRSTLPSSARIGSTRASWLCKQPLGDLATQAANPKLGPDSDEGSLSSGTYSLSGAPPPCTSSEMHILPVQQNWPQPPGSSSQTRSTSAVKESDILSDDDDDGFSEGGTRRGSGDSSSPTSAIEAQFLQLKLSEDAAPAPCVQPEGVGDTPETQPKLRRGHFNAVKRNTNSLRRSQGALLNMKAHSTSMDSQTDAASSSGVMDFNTLLEREFSVQSLASVVNEDCFYDPAESCATESGNATSS